jgi:NAD(P)-dependent dehydrogenase (short-subunit alcohol dehydrogenase family)
VAAETTTTVPGSDAFGIAGSTVIVTGASSGLGESIARHLASVGANVVLVGRRAERIEALAAEFDHALPVPADVTEDDDRAAVVDATVATFGRIDGLVNNAGAALGLPAAKESPGQFRQLVDVNLVAPFAMSTACLPQLREAGGAIVNVASIAGLAASGLHIPQASYCASKAGLVNLTRELAVQWGRYGIRVNTLAPGFFPTEMTAPLLVGIELPDWIAGRLALRRAGDAAELGPVTQFLLSAAASYITGAVVAVDGGYSAS